MNIMVNEARPTQVDAGELLSDVLQADQAILYDARGALASQLSVYGMDRMTAAAKLRECADLLEEGSEVKVR